VCIATWSEQRGVAAWAGTLLLCEQLTLLLVIFLLGGGRLRVAAGTSPVRLLALLVLAPTFASDLRKSDVGAATPVFAAGMGARSKKVEGRLHAVVALAAVTADDTGTSGCVVGLVCLDLDAAFGGAG
jgi:hypothetical protein